MPVRRRPAIQPEVKSLRSALLERALKNVDRRTELEDIVYVDTASRLMAEAIQAGEPVVVHMLPRDIRPEFPRQVNGRFVHWRIYADDTVEPVVLVSDGVWEVVG